MLRLRGIVATLAVVAGFGVWAAPAYADDTISMWNTTLVAGNRSQEVFAEQNVTAPLPAVADASDRFTVSMPAALAPLASIAGATCAGNPSPGVWTGCQIIGIPFRVFWINYQGAQTVYPLVGQDFTTTVRDETTGRTGSGEVHIRASADLQLIGPFPSSAAGQAPWSGLGYTVRNAGPSRAGSLVLTVTFSGNATTPSIPSACTRSGQVVRCTLDTLEPDSTGFWRLFILLGSDTGSITMTSEVSGSVPDPDMSNNQNTSERFDLYGNGPVPGVPAAPGSPAGSNSRGHAGNSSSPIPAAAPATPTSETATSDRSPSTGPTAGPVPAAVTRASGSVSAPRDHSSIWPIALAAGLVLLGAGAGLVARRRRHPSVAPDDSPPTAP